MQPATTAPPLPLPQITLRTPLVSLDVARAALRMTTNEVMALIDARRLRYCFNVAVEIIYRREVRILANSLAHYQRGARTRFGDGDELQAVIRMIFPMAPAPRFGVVSTLRATTIARQLSLKTDTVLALLDAGWLRSPTNSERHPGPTGSPAIEFSSVVEFLKKRRIV